MTDQVEQGERVKEVPFLLVLDYDKTLSNTQRHVDRFYATASECGVSDQQIQAMKVVQAEKEANKESVSLLDFIRDYDPEMMDQFKETYRSIQGYDTQYPDAERFMSRVEQVGIPSVVVTFGDPEWQHLKMDADGYQGLRHVIDHQYKARMLNDLHQDDGIYRMKIDGQVIVTKNVCLIDDKADAFHEFDEGVGLWIQRSELSANQRGKVGPNVAIIHSLDEVDFQDGAPILITQKLAA